MAEQGTNPFSVRTVAIVLLAGIIAFLGFLFLMAYAPQIKARGSSGPQPLSKSAVGFYGLYKLSEATGRLTQLTESADRWSAPGFMLVTIQPDTDPDKLRDLVRVRRGTEQTKTLYILPKYTTAPLRTKSGWVQNTGILDGFPPRLLSVFGPIQFAVGRSPRGNIVRGIAGSGMDDVSVTAPATLSYIRQGIEPVLVDAGNRIVLGRTGQTNGSAD